MGNTWEKSRIYIESEIARETSVSYLQVNCQLRKLRKIGKRAICHMRPVDREENYKGEYKRKSAAMRARKGGRKEGNR